MLMIILDTNVVSEGLKANPAREFIKWQREQRTPDLYITAATAAELRAGARILPSGRRQTALTTAIEAVIEIDFDGRVLPFDCGASKHYAMIWAHRRAIGRPITIFDCQIAAIASETKSTVATRNTRDFQDCGITLINPWNP